MAEVIKTRVASDGYRTGFDRIFGKCPLLEKTRQNEPERDLIHATPKGNTDAGQSQKAA